MADLEQYLHRIQPKRRIQGIAAALLPFDSDGRIAEDAFVAHLKRTRDAGLVNAVNMDTGYVNHLSDEEKRRVLMLARTALGKGTRFIAGAFIEGREGDVVSLYRREIERIVEHGGTPILFQTSRLHGRPPSEKVEAYRRAVQGAAEALAFELGPVFAPNGEIFDDETVRGIMEIPEIVGMKHSSLNRLKELERLEMRDRLRPDFAIYTGNDLGISMVEYGSDYLLGLATFCPEKFAARDRAWAAGDPSYFELSDALQNLGTIAFRPPVPAYKHSAAHFLHLLGHCPTSRARPGSPTRPDWEPEIMRYCARRLNLL